MRHGAFRTVKAVALAAAVVTAAGCGASSKVEQEVLARNAAARSGGAAGAGAVALGAGSMDAAALGSAGDSTSISGDAAGGAASSASAGTGAGAGSGSATGRTVTSGPGARSSSPGAAAAGTNPSGAGSASPGSSGSASAGAPAPAGGNGGATDVGVTATSIKIGGTFFNGGYLDKYSQVAEQSASAYFKYINDRGGVYGRKIEFSPCDTAGTADGTQGCLRKLVNDDKVFAMGPSEDFNLDTVPTFLAEKQIPWIGSSGFYPEEHASPWMFPSQIPAREVGTGIGSFARKTLAAETVAVSYLTEGPGRDCTEGVKALASKAGFKVVATVENSQTQGDLTQQVLKVKQANPDAVLFCNDPVNTVKFVQAAGRVGYKPPKGWVGGFVAADDVPLAMGSHGVGFYGFSSYDFYRGTSPGVVEYRRITESYFPSIFHHFYTQATYVGAKALVDAMTKAGPELTRAKLVAAMKSLTDFDSGMGLRFDFSGKVRRASGIMLQADEKLRWQQKSERFAE